MKLSLLAIMACCATTGPALALTDVPIPMPPRVAIVGPSTVTDVPIPMPPRLMATGGK